MRFILVILTLILGLPAWAGVVELTNGDRLEGEVVRIEGDDLVWKSTNFGEQRIKKSKIKNLISDKPLKVSANKKACIVDRVEQEQLVYYCGARANLKHIPVLSLKTLLPYEDYVGGKWLNSGKLNLWGAYSSGNETRNEWNLQGETKLRIDELRHVISGEYAKSAYDHLTPQTRWNLHYSLDWFFRPRWFWYNSLDAGADDQRSLNQSYILGSGSGYQFWETKKTALSLQLGLSYVDQEFEPPADPGEFDQSASYAATRLATDFRYELPGGVSFFHNNELVYSLEDSKDWQLKTSTGLSTMLLNKVYSEFKVDYWVFNEPQPTKERADTRMSVGVSYKW